jgi:hypothetical protein
MPESGNANARVTALALECMVPPSAAMRVAFDALFTEMVDKRVDKRVRSQELPVGCGWR